MGRWTQILLFYCLILFVHPSELKQDFGDGDDVLNQANDVRNWGRNFLPHLQNAHQFESGPVHLQFQPVHENFESELLKELLHYLTKCHRDLLYVAENLNGATGQWAMKMLDAFGKPGSGILEGMTNWVGEYTECTKVYAPPNLNLNAGDLSSTSGNFHGQYCSMIWSFRLLNFTLPVTSGLCVPDTCSSPEIQEIAKLFLPVIGVLAPNGSDIMVNVTSVTCRPTHRTMNASAIVVIVLMSFFCTFVIFGSSITAVKSFMEEKDTTQKLPLVINSPQNDLTADENGKLKENADLDGGLHLENKSLGKLHGIWKKCESFLECFCIFRNGAKLLNTAGGEGELMCIHGIRFLSMSWVILGHVYGITSVTRNLLETYDSGKTFAFQIVLQGFFAVDSFFVLSGFLLTYLSMKEFAKDRGGISWPYFYLHRYLRLTPVYMIALAFAATAYNYIGSGPFWPLRELDPVCRDNWWRNMLYINNFAEVTNACMPWSWYLANDMQFFVISPLFLITLWRWPKIGYSLVAVTVCVCWVTNFALTYQYDLIPGAANFLDQPIGNMEQTMARFGEYYDKVYIKPYGRIGPYMMGMLAGYLLFARKRDNKTKHSWVFISVGWTVASTITLVCVYGLYRADPSLVARCFYNAFSRTLFGAGLSWVIYVCLIDQGGVVNSILSFKLFIPLSRLTYAAYLIHPMVTTNYFSSLRLLFEFSHPTMVLTFLGIMVETYCVSLLVALVFESPLIGLEKLIRSRFAQKKIERTQ